MPISSHQISGLIGGQFQQSQMLSYGLGQPMMMGAQPMSGQSEYPAQMARPQAMVMPQAPSMAPMSQMGMSPLGPFSAPPAFNYGLPQGPTMSSHAGAFMAGGVGAFGTGFGALTGAAGIASMAGVGGPLVGALGMMDPFGAALAAGQSGMGLGGRLGLGMAGRIGMGALAGTGVGLGIAGLFETARMGTSAFMGGFQHQQAIGAQLSQLNFANVGAPTGRGFAPGQMARIGAGARSFESADPFTTMADMNALLSQFTDMGMAQGVRDAEEFSSKFTKMANTVRSMSMAMGTSLQDAARTFGEMRQAGFYTASDVMGNVTQQQLMRGMGMSSSQFAQMQAQGAGFARANQMSGIAGARAVTNLAGGLMMSGNEQQLMDITGGANLAESAQLMSQNVVGQGTQFLTQSGAGAAMLMALGQTNSSGQFTGGINQDVLRQLSTGQVSLQDLSRMGQQNLRGQGRQSFVHRRRDIAQSLMQQEDFIPAILETIMREQAGDEDMQAILAERMLGMDRRTFDVMKEQVDNWASNRRERNRRLQEELGAQTMQSEIARNRSFTGLVQRTRGGLEDMFSPVAQMGQNLSTQMEETGMRVSDQFWGIQRTRLTAAGVDRTAFALASGAASGMRGPMDVSAFSSGGFLGNDQSLAGAVARGSGAAQAVAVQNMAQFGSLSDIGTGLGISESRQGKLQKFAQTLKGDREIQGLIREAQFARMNGDTKRGKAIQRQIRDKISKRRSEYGMLSGGADDTFTQMRDTDLKDTAFVLGELGASELVNEQLTEEAGVAGSNAFLSVEDAKQAMSERAAEEFGTNTAVGLPALGRIAESIAGADSEDRFKTLATVVATGGLAAPYLAFKAATRPNEAGIINGEAGSSVLAAMVGREEEVLKALDVALNSKGDQKRAFASALRAMFPGQTITDEDAAAAMGKMQGRSLGDLKKLSSFAAAAEQAIASPQVAAAAARSFEAAVLPGLEEERVAAAMAFGGGGDISGSVSRLVEAAAGEGVDLSHLSNAGILGQTVSEAASGLKAVRAMRGDISQKDIVSAFKSSGISIEQVRREAERMGIKAESLSKEQAESLAKQISSGLVIGQAGAGVTGVTFSGGADPAVTQMSLAQQIQRNTELLDAVDSKVTGREPTSGVSLSKSGDNKPAPSLYQRIFGG